MPEKTDLPALDAAPVLRGSRTLLMGPPGTGKTWSLSTLVEAGLELFCLFTDPGGEESLIDAIRAKDLDIDRVHWRYVAPSNPSWDTLLKMAKQIGSMSYKGLSEIKSGIDKQEYQQFYEMLGYMSNFVDERTGEEFGPIDSWGPDRAFAFDGISGMNIMALDMMLGAKPTAHEGEWGVSMRAEEMIIQKLTGALSCFSITIGHVEREPNIITGIPQQTLGMLGKKLAPKIPRLFSDVVLSVRTGRTFTWSTIEDNTDLKTRCLPLDANMAPDFGQIVKVWEERRKLVEVEPVTETETATEGKL